MPVGKQCGEKLCPKFTALGQRYCPEHTKTEPSHNFKRDSRGKNRFYDSKAWKIVRQAALAKNPICEICRRKPATVVHHLIRLKERPDLALEEANLQTACASCHNSESQREMTELAKYKTSFVR